MIPIIYYSHHHGNTKKVLDAIARADEKVRLVDVAEAPVLIESGELDLASCEKIGLASGIYYSKFAKQVLAFAEEQVPAGAEVFLLATAGNPGEGFFKGLREILEAKGCKVTGQHICAGYDTYGPFKLVGGLKKGHPDEEDLAAAVAWYEGLAHE